VWYHNIGRTIYLESDITVGNGETLIFRNVIVKANQTDIGITVEDGGEFGMYQGSKITTSSNSDGYFIQMNEGSNNQVINSTIEKATSGTGLTVSSSQTYVYNSTFRYNGDHGISIDQCVPTIVNSHFYHHDTGIQIYPFSNAVLYGNRINETGTGVEYFNSNFYEMINTNEMFERIVSTHGSCSYDSLVINKDEPNGTQFLVSILNPINNDPICGYEDLEDAEINLGWINVTSYPSIKIRAEPINNGSIFPTLISWQVYFGPYGQQSCEMSSYVQLSNSSSIQLSGGFATLVLNETEGYGVTLPFTKEDHDSWAYVSINSNSSSYCVKLTLIDTATGSVIYGYENIITYNIDISSFNDLGIDSFKVRFELFDNGTPPTLDWIKIFTVPIFEENEIVSNNIGVITNNTLPVIRNNNISDNDDIGLSLWEPRSNAVIDGALPFILSGGEISDNGIGLFADNTSVSIHDTNFTDNERTISVQRSLVIMDGGYVVGNEDEMYINNSIVDFKYTTFMDTDFSFDVDNSHITFQEIGKTGCQPRQMELQRSTVIFLDRDNYDDIMLMMGGLSTFYGNWSYSLSISDPDTSSSEGATAVFRNLNMEICLTETVIEGQVSGSLAEKKITNTGISVETPHNVKIGGRNDFYMYMVSPQYHSVRYGYDSDGDSIADIAEKEEGKYLIECEDVVADTKICQDGAIQLSSGEPFIVPIDITLPEFEVGQCVYSLVMRAQAYNGTEQRSLTVDMDNFTQPVTESFDITYDMRWYQTNWYTPSSSHITGTIVDDDPEGKVIVDKYILLKKTASENPPVLGSPLISDIDEDDLMDGYERTRNGFYMEAEHMTDTGIVDSTESSNGKYVSSNQIGFDANIQEEGEYILMVRAKNSTGYLRTIDIDVNGTNIGIIVDLTDVFEWHQIDIELTEGIRGITLEESNQFGYIGIDKILLVKRSDVYVETVTGGGSIYTSEIPQWGLVTSARASYTSNSLIHNYSNTNIGDITHLDTSGNITVYSSGLNVAAYNISTDTDYLAETGGTYSTTEPSVDEVEMVYRDNTGNDGGNIWYCDLRKGPDLLDPYIISDIDSASYKGREPIISDGTIVWHSDDDADYDMLYVLILDSMTFITIGDNDYNILNYDVCGRFLSWIEETIANGDQAIKIADIGISADIQTDSVDEIGLTPYIRTLTSSSSNTYGSVDIYNNKICYLETQDNSSRIMIYDKVTDQIVQEYPYEENTHSSYISLDKPALISGGYVCWQECVVTTYALIIKEIGYNPIKTCYSGTEPVDYSLYFGSVYYASSVSQPTAIKGFVQDIKMEIGETPFYSSGDIALKDHWTTDFSSELNQELLNSQESSSSVSEEEGSYLVSLNIDIDLGNSLTLTALEITIDGLTDPFTSDMDYDYLSDGEEMLSYYNRTIIEVEDTNRFVEWIEPSCGASDGLGYAGMVYKYSPMFYAEGVDLMTGAYRLDEEEDTWTDTSSRIGFDIHEIIPGEKTIVKTLQNERIKSAYSDIDDFDFGNKVPSMDVRTSEGELTKGELSLSTESYRLNDTEMEYISQVLDQVLVFNYSGSGCDHVDVSNEYRDYSVLWCYIGRIVDSPAEYYSEESENDIMMFGFTVDYEAEMTFPGSGNYQLDMRLDLDLLPQELDPILKEDLGENSLVPDGFVADRFHFIRLVNLDSIVVAGYGLDPMSKDTDDDQLVDGIEVYLDTFPLSNDADKDGISDYLEIETYGTKPNKRDSDTDGIRDPVESSILSIDLLTESSSGSWFERKMRNNDYFDLSNISNLDADFETSTDPTEIDTDKDGLPDGWIDGWKYFGEYFRGIGTSCSYYSPENWRGGLDYDCRIQVYEGEDINCDGNTIDLMSSWDFDGMTFEFAGEDSAECNPNSDDTDGDRIPDGYEVWYGIKEPYLDGSGNLILNPCVDDDKDYDLDPSGRYTLVSTTVKTPLEYSYTDSTRIRLAQEIDVPMAGLRTVCWIGVPVESGDTVNCIEIWSGYSGGNNHPERKITTIYGSEESITGSGLTTFIFKIPSGLFYNGLDSAYSQVFYLVVPYTGARIDWSKASNGSGGTCYYSGSSWTTISDELNYVLYNHSLSGDKLTNLEA
jgi:hypothetical protein